MMVLVNPAAGGGHAGRKADAVLSRVNRDLDVRRTVGPGHATALVKAARERGESQFLSVGGDGTLYEVVNGAMAAGSGTPRLAILPMGTGNSFGRDIGVTSVEAAIEALNNGTPRPCDVVELVAEEGTSWSINLVGLGFSALAGDLMNRRFKRLGAAGYILAVLVELARLQAPTFRYRTAQIDAEPGEWRTEDLVMLSMCNSRFTGGAMEMAPDAAIDDGLLDLVALHPMTRTRFLRAFPRIFHGTHPRLDEITVARAARVELELRAPIDVMIDGEIAKLTLESVTVKRHALEVLCPQT